MTTELFNTRRAGGGNKYENIKDGLYKGKLLRLEVGPTFYDTKEISPEFPEGKPQPKTRWVWELFDLQGNTLGEEISELTSKATGERSTAAKYFTAHLGFNFDDRQHDIDEAIENSIGKMVMLSVSTKPSGYRKVDVFPVA